MARPIPEPPYATSAPQGRAPRVDWMRYTDGRWWELIPEEDFEQEPRTAAQAFRAWCSRNGHRAVTVVDDVTGNLYVRVVR